MKKTHCDSSQEKLNHIDTGKSISHVSNGDCRMFSPIFDNGMLSNFTRACGDIEAAVLACALEFRANYSKIKSLSGKNTITITRQAIADIFGWSLKKVDNTIPKLAATGFVSISKRKVGNAELYFFEFDEIGTRPLHITAFRELSNEIGSNKEAILYSYVIDCANRDPVIHNNTQGCAMTMQQIASFLGVSLPSARQYLNNLRRKGILKTEKFLYEKQRCLHIALGENDMQACLAKHLDKKAPAKVAPIQVAKQSTGHLPKKPEVVHEDMPPKVIPSSKEKKGEGKQGVLKKRGRLLLIDENKEKNNNIITKNSKKIELIPWQKKYAQGALRKTLRDKGREHLFPQYWPEVEFSLTNHQQHRNTENFQHTLNRIMSLIRDGAWGTPHGFKNHSEAGQKMAAYRKFRIAEHEKFKQLECSPSSLHRLAV